MDTCNFALDSLLPRIDVVRISSKTIYIILMIVSTYRKSRVLIEALMRFGTVRTGTDGCNFSCCAYLLAAETPHVPTRTQTLMHELALCSALHSPRREGDRPVIVCQMGWTGCSQPKALVVTGHRTGHRLSSHALVGQSTAVRVGEGPERHQAEPSSVQFVCSVAAAGLVWTPP